MNTRIKREEFVIDAINKQFEIANIDPTVLKTDPTGWFSNNTMTDIHHQQWKLWFIAECRKRFKYSKHAAEREFDYFDLSYGLKIKNDPLTETTK